MPCYLHIRILSILVATVFIILYAPSSKASDSGLETHYFDRYDVDAIVETTLPFSSVKMIRLAPDGRTMDVFLFIHLDDLSVQLQSDLKGYVTATVTATKDRKSLLLVIKYKRMKSQYAGTFKCYKTTTTSVLDDCGLRIDVLKDPSSVYYFENHETDVLVELTVPVIHSNSWARVAPVRDNKNALLTSVSSDMSSMKVGAQYSSNGQVTVEVVTKYRRSILLKFASMTQEYEGHFKWYKTTTDTEISTGQFTIVVEDRSRWTNEAPYSNAYRFYKNERNCRVETKIPDFSWEMIRMTTNSLEEEPFLYVYRNMSVKLSSRYTGRVRVEVDKDRRSLQLVYKVMRLRYAGTFKCYRGRTSAAPLNDCGINIVVIVPHPLEFHPDHPLHSEFQCIDEGVLSFAVHLTGSPVTHMELTRDDTGEASGLLHFHRVEEGVWKIELFVLSVDDGGRYTLSIWNLWPESLDYTFTVTIEDGAVNRTQGRQERSSGSQCMKHYSSQTAPVVTIGVLQGCVLGPALLLLILIMY